jgi:thiosulfate/3-mercaptopyruvate sulfurtransferase
MARMIQVRMERCLRSGLKTCAVVFLTVLCSRAHAQAPVSASQTASARAEIPAGELLQPEELEQILRASGGEKPLILQVGSHVLYAEAHIPGSEYAGAAGQQEGLQSLQERVKALDRSQFIVLYCGCCPWIKCPNIRAAYQQLHSLGFTRVKALYLATNFGTDWVNKGYPVARGR